MTNFRRGFLVLSLGSLGGKVAALLREVVFASAFGTGTIATGFRIAQTASIVPANLVSGDLLSAAFAPAYARASANNPKLGRAMLWGYSAWLTATLVLVALLVFFYRSFIVSIIIPGSDSIVMVQAIEFIGILCWTIPLFGLASLQAYALGVQNIYLMTSIRPLIQSIGLLFGTIVAVLTGWIPWLALGFLSAWILYVALCSTLLIRGGYLGPPNRAYICQGWRFVISGFKAIAPLLLLPVIMQASIILERVFSSYGPTGLVASVDYARTVSESVMSLVAVPLGILGLTQLSAAKGDDYKRLVSKMCDFVVVSMLPISAILVVASNVIIHWLYGRGNFDSSATNLTATVLIGLSVGLMFQVLGYSLSRALTAAGRNRAVLLYTLIAIFGQVATQMIGISCIGPIAIGLGPSVFGLLLSLGCAYALGQLKRIGLHLIGLFPGIACTLVLCFSNFSHISLFFLVSVAWVLNIIVIPSSRAVVMELARPLGMRVVERIRRN